jgi:ubiquinone/menaquinone biosynthesis C-methylase UbiE/uncharacterized protein YbaR (Trm112 family)
VNEQVIDEYLTCPACGAAQLHIDSFERVGPEINNGVVSCRQCATWYRLEDGLLELLVPALRLPATDAAFQARVSREFGGWRYATGPAQDVALDEHKLGQRVFYDEDAGSYETSMMRLPFWTSFDRAYTRTIESFTGHRPVMLEVGGGSGRQSIPLRDSFSTILSFDISEAMVRRAMRRFSEVENSKRNIHYFVGDAENIPVRSGFADAAIFSGILHHVAAPDRVIRETARALRAGGRFVGMENNRTVLRPLFDTLMNLVRLWNEKAHPEHFTISSRELHAWFAQAGLTGDVWTSVFLPPHLFSAVPASITDSLLRVSDTVCRSVPGLRNQGGLVLFKGEKPSRVDQAVAGVIAV